MVGKSRLERNDPELGAFPVSYIVSEAKDALDREHPAYPAAFSSWLITPVLWICRTYKRYC